MDAELSDAQLLDCVQQIESRHNMLPLPPVEEHRQIQPMEIEYVGSSDIQTMYEDISDDEEQEINNIVPINQHGRGPSHASINGASSSRPSGEEKLNNESVDEIEEEGEKDEEEEEDLFNAVVLDARTSRKFHVKSEILTFELKRRDSPVTINWIQRLILQILKTITSHFNPQPEERVRIEINDARLDIPIQVAFKPYHELTPELIISAIELVMQSKKSLAFDEQTAVTIVYIPMNRGGMNPNYVYDKMEFVKHKRRTLIRPCQNKGFETCLSQCIILGWNELTNRKETPMDRSRYTYIRTNPKTTPLQTDMAIVLCTAVGIDPKKPCGLPEWNKFQLALNEGIPEWENSFQVTLKAKFQLFIYSGDQDNTEIFRGNSDLHAIPLRLYLLENHFYYIKIFPSLFNRTYYCHTCNKPYNNKSQHRCVNYCFNCKRSSNCTKDSERIQCEDCSRFFKGITCFENHKTNTMNQHSVCETFESCQKCFSTIERHTDHICDIMKCATCKLMCGSNHKCYIQRLADEDESMRYFVFYDFETMLNEQREHVPILCVCDRVCTECIGKPIDSHCDKCNVDNPVRQMVFYGLDCISTFCKWILDTEMIKGKRLLKNRHSRFIAHNSQAFDGILVIRYLVTQTVVQPSIIANGTKILCMTLPAGIRFLDSLLFMPMKLSQFSKTFHLPVTKGIFPYRFLTVDTLNYIGPMPDLSYYEMSSLTPTENLERQAWYDTRCQTNNRFNTKDELISYCKDDVQLLRLGCAKFRSMFLNLTGVSPFQTAITIASLCNRVYRNKFLPPYTLAIAPQGKYVRARKHSNSAIKCMQFIEYTEGVKIQHARNGGERVIYNMNIDGFYHDPITNQGVCIEFLGCVVHGCLCIKNREKLSPFNNKKMGDLYEEHLIRMQRLRLGPYRVRCIWECEFEALKQTPRFQIFNKNIAPLVAPLDARDGFYGGRVNLLKFYHKPKEGELIHYIDICSLYPYICKTGTYPIGHPVIILHDFQSIENYFGFVKCDVIPPYDLYIPVLPYRCNGKLLFPLCAKCAHDKLSAPCEHTERERTLSGTWVISEVLVALQNGYRISLIYEVWHYPHTRTYDANATFVDECDLNIKADTIDDNFQDIAEDELFNQIPNKDLFSDYINMFLQIKQEASGYPSDLEARCQTCKDLENCPHIDWSDLNARRDKYIDEYEQREHVRLDKSKIEKNPGLRYLSKGALNNLWGKFCYNNQKRTQTDIVSNVTTFYDMIYDGTKTVNHVEILSDEKVLVNYKHNKDLDTDPNYVNVPVGAFTTALARLKLFECLDKLRHRVLYFDTDSVIYTQSRGQDAVKLGNFLGDFTNEIPDNSRILEYCATGPKSYALKIISDDTGELSYQIKTKGVTLDNDARKLVNFDSIVRLVHDHTHTIKVSYPNSFHRDKSFRVSMREKSKTMAFNYDKRVHTSESYDTTPYGYVRDK